MVAGKTTRSKTVYAIACVCKEGRSFSVHLSRKISPFFIDTFSAVIQKVYRLDGESQNFLGSFFIEPFHKVLLKPVECVPYRLGVVREKELAKHTVEIRVVEIRHIPKTRLIISCGGWLRNRINNLLKFIFNKLFKCSAAFCVRWGYIIIEMVNYLIF